MSAPEAYDDVRGRFVTSRRLTSVAIAYLILLASFAVGLWALEQRDIERTDEAALASCERVNRLREGLNQNALVLAVSLNSALRREHKLATTGPDRKTHGESAAALGGLRRYYLYRPLTDCSRAVHDPDGYVPPAPRPFTRAQLKTIHLPGR